MKVTLLRAPGGGVDSKKESDFTGVEAVCLQKINELPSYVRFVSAHQLKFSQHINKSKKNINVSILKNCEECYGKKYRFYF